MAVSKDKNGTYKVQYYRTDIDGKRKLTTKRGFQKKSEAQLFDCEMRKRGKKGQKDVGGMLLADFIKKYYLPHIEENLKKKSIATKLHLINTHILNIHNKPIASFKNMKLRDITADELIRWQKMKKQEGYSDGYLLSIRKELSAILNFAERQYGWLDNPSKNVPRMGKFNKRVRKDEWWTIDEFEQFISTVNKSTMYYVIWNLLFYSGIRLGELLALKPSDISLMDNSISIFYTYSRLDREDIVTAPKTENSERIVYIPQDTMDLLQDYLKRNPNIQKNDRIFPVTHRAVEMAFARHIKKSNSRYITVHCLRHSHTAYLINMRAFEMTTISQRLGHKDAVITSQVYAHVYNETAMGVAKIMQNNMNSRKSNEENNS